MNPVAARPEWVVIDTDDGSIDYRYNADGSCRCRATGAETIEAGNSLFGPSAEVGADGYTVCEVERQPL